jgi:hypothetical protein
MSKKFLLDLPDTEHQSLKVAAVQSGASMNQFIREAIKEKILRQHLSEALHTSGADANTRDALTKASDKPA